MAIVKTIKKGESLSFGFAFPDTYDITRLQNVKVYIGSSVYTHSMDGQKIRVVLRSNDTKLLTGTNVINLLVDDSVFGIRKVDYGSLHILPTQAVFSDESFNAGYDFLIPLIVTENTISVENVLYSVIEGEAATIEVGTVTTLAAGEDATVENVGDENEAVFNFGIPQGIQGERGLQGYTPYIGENGNWFINGVDTGVQAEGDATEAWVTQNYLGKLDVVGELGSSETKVVNQKKITEEINSTKSAIGLTYSNQLITFTNITQETFNGTSFVPSSTRIALPTLMKIKEGNVLAITINSGYSYEIEKWDANRNYLSLQGWLTATSYITGDDVSYITFLLRKDDNSAITPAEFSNTGFSVTCLRESGIQDIKAKIPTYEYLSKTNNILDLSAAQNISKRITDTYPYFISANEGQIISGPIYVKGLTHITHKSSDTSSNYRRLVFTTDKSMSGDSVVATNVGIAAGQLSAVIPVPPDAVYMYVNLRTSGDASDIYASDKISNSDVATDDNYEEGDILEMNQKRIVREINNERDYSEIKKYERIDTENRALPYSIGSAIGGNPGTSYDRFNFIFFSDSHIDYSNPEASLENVIDTIDFANQSKLPLKAVVHGGDFITTASNTKSTVVNIANRYFSKVKNSMLPFLQAIGNHDSNDWNTNIGTPINDSDWSSMLFDSIESDFGIVRNLKSDEVKSSYHYIDFEAQKVRIIILNVQDIPRGIDNGSGKEKYNGSNTFYVGQEQMDWLCNVALNFDDKSNKGWGVIACMHQDRTYSSSVITLESSINKVYEVIKAFNSQTTYTNNYVCAADSRFNLNISADFTRYATGYKPYFIAMLLGHEHFDKHSTENGILEIWIGNGSATNSSSDSRIPRTLQTKYQNLFDIISVDLITKKIYITRYGAGINCFGNGGDRFKPEGLSF